MHSGKKPQPQTPRPQQPLKNYLQLFIFIFLLEFVLTVLVPFSSSICLNLGASEVFCYI